jgi:hypothetical protein
MADGGCSLPASAPDAETVLSIPNLSRADLIKCNPAEVLRTFGGLGTEAGNSAAAARLVAEIEIHLENKQILRSDLASILESLCGHVGGGFLQDDSYNFAQQAMCAIVGIMSIDDLKLMSPDTVADVARRLYFPPMPESDSRKDSSNKLINYLRELDLNYQPSDSYTKLIVWPVCRAATEVLLSQEKLDSLVSLHVSSMSMDNRPPTAVLLEYAQGIADCVAQVFGLPHIPVENHAFSTKCRGLAVRASMKVQVDLELHQKEFSYFVFSKLRDTILHECRHIYQYALADDLFEYRYTGVKDKLKEFAQANSLPLSELEECLAAERSVLRREPLVFQLDNHYSEYYSERDARRFEGNVSSWVLREKTNRIDRRLASLE